VLVKGCAYGAQGRVFKMPDVKADVWVEFEGGNL
jgi:hypothetical protein